jgi:spore coat protein CotF
MQGLKQSELNWIREVVSCHQTVASKLSTYADQVNDPQIKQMFTQASTKARQSAQNLIQML